MQAARQTQWSYLLIKEQISAGFYIVGGRIKAGWDQVSVCKKSSTTLSTWPLRAAGKIIISNNEELLDAYCGVNSLQLATVVTECAGMTRPGPWSALTGWLAG